MIGSKQDWIPKEKIVLYSIVGSRKASQEKATIKWNDSTLEEAKGAMFDDECQSRRYLHQFIPASFNKDKGIYGDIYSLPYTILVWNLYLGIEYLSNNAFHYAIIHLWSLKRFSDC